MPYLYAKIEGLVGRIDIPDLGAHIGDFVTATLMRRGDVKDNPQDPEGDFFDLYAVLRFVNQALYEDPDYEKVITVWPKNQPKKRWILESTEPGRRMALRGRNFTMDRVKIIKTGG